MLPSFDYSYTPDEPVAGGELTVNVNAREIVRDELDCVFRRVPLVRGIEGQTGRVTAEAEWKTSIVTGGRPGGDAACSTCAATPAMPT